MKQVNITAHMIPETKPAVPIARITCQGRVWPRRRSAITTQIAADDKRFGKEAKKVVAAAWKKVGL
jgi:hypothetical protein